MFLENAEVANSAFIASLGLLLAACFIALMGWLAAFKPIGAIRPDLKSGNSQTRFDLSAPHPQGKIFGLVFFGVALFLACFATMPLINGASNYNRIELKPDSLNLHYSFWKTPRSFAFSDLRSVNVNQEYVVRNRSHSYWLHLVLTLKSGEIIEPAWHISSKDSDGQESHDYTKLERLANEMKKQGLPVKFTYTDRKGIQHPTENIRDRPETSR